MASKYALALYDLVAKRARLQFVQSETFPINVFRSLMDVPQGRLDTYSNLFTFALKPAFDKVNRLADCYAAFKPVKASRKVGDLAKEQLYTFALLRRLLCGNLL